MFTKDRCETEGDDGPQSSSCVGGEGAPDVHEPSDVAISESRPLDPVQNDDDPSGDGSPPADGNTASPDDSSDAPHRTWEDVGMYQGYTPLTDDTMWTGQGAVLTTFGPLRDANDDDENDNFHGTGGGLFFADMSAFFQAESARAGAVQDASHSDVSSHARDDEVGEGGDEKRRPRKEGVDDGNDSSFDYRSIADRALAALDRDYEQVVSVPLPKQEVVDAMPTNDGDSVVPNQSTDAASGQGTTSEHGEKEAEASLPSLLSSTTSIQKGELNRTTDGDHPFVADFSGPMNDAIVNVGARADLDGDPNDATPAPTLSTPTIIDVKAVQRAVQAIQSKRPEFVSHVDEWERAETRGDDGSTRHALQMLLATVPREHAIIPPTPLKAFRRKTARAVAATGRLTRSATIAEALRRLDLLQSQDQLVIHVVGCDSVECQSEEHVRAHFGPIANWIGSCPFAPRNLSIVLLGPNIPASAPTLVQLALLSVRSTAEVRCVRGGLYHECLTTAAAAEPAPPSDGSSVAPHWLVPDLVVAFHAGIWGYLTWEATFEHHVAHSNRHVPWVITAYTIQEAEDDAEALEGILLRQPPTNEGDRASVDRVWPPGWNPYASRLPRETATAPEGRIYRENAAWSCWKI